MSDSWFKIIGGYSASKGVEVEMWARGGISRTVTLTKNDVSYLLECIDGHATAGANPIASIAFPLHGLLIQLNDEEWTQFVDELGAAAGKGGWRPQFVA